MTLDGAQAPSWAEAIVAGQRRALSRAITRMESRRDADQRFSGALLDALGSHGQSAARIGISGAPGAGKSSLLAALGAHLLTRGLRPAVLAIDPTSEVSGGSILGDKTRMQALARTESAYVRPSPSGPAGVGVCPTTAETAQLCAAAGFDPVFIETVGVGQAETSAVSVVDLLVVVLEPGAGDELQGIKRGLLEWADLVVVHKADGVRRPLAERMLQQLLQALPLLRARESEPTPVQLVSSLEGMGVGELWDTLARQIESMRQSGEWSARRRRRAARRLELSLRQQLFDHFLREPQRREAYQRALGAVAGGDRSVRAALAELLPDP